MPKYSPTYLIRALSSKSLNERAFANSVVVSGSYIASQALRLISNLILSRILAPDAFGLMMLTMTFLQGFQMMSDVGTGPSIIKSSRSDERIFRDTAWTLQALRGVLVTAFTLICAIPAAKLYNEPELALLISFTAIAALIDGVCPISRHMASRTLSYLRVGLVELSSQLITMFITIVLAIKLQSVWALAIGAVSGIALKTIGLYAFLPNSKNWFKFERSAFNEIFSYGKWIFLSTGLTFLARHGDKLILGAFLTKSDLGAYAIALFIIEGISGLVNKLMAEIVFPILSKFAREDPTKIQDAYYRSRKKLETITIPIAGLLITCGQQIVDILYDDRYQLAGVMLQILGLRLAITIITTPGSNALMATERVYWLPIIRVAGLITMAIVIPISNITWGSMGVIWGATLSYIIYIPMTLIALKNLKIVSIKRELFFILPLGASLILGYFTSLALNSLAT